MSLADAIYGSSRSGGRPCSAKGCTLPIIGSYRTKAAGTLDLCKAHHKVLSIEGEIVSGPPAHFEFAPPSAIVEKPKRIPAGRVRDRGLPVQSTRGRAAAALRRALETDPVVPEASGEVLRAEPAAAEVPAANEATPATPTPCPTPDPLPPEAPLMDSEVAEVAESQPATIAVRPRTTCLWPGCGRWGKICGTHRSRRELLRRDGYLTGDETDPAAYLEAFRRYNDDFPTRANLSERLHQAKLGVGREPCQWPGCSRPGKLCTTHRSRRDRLFNRGYLKAGDVATGAELAAAWERHTALTKTEITKPSRRPGAERWRAAVRHEADQRQTRIAELEGELGLTKASLAAALDTARSTSGHLQDLAKACTLLDQLGFANGQPVAAAIEQLHGRLTAKQTELQRAHADVAVARQELEEHRTADAAESAEKDGIIRELSRDLIEVDQALGLGDGDTRWKGDRREYIRSFKIRETLEQSAKVRRDLTPQWGEAGPPPALTADLELRHEEVRRLRDSVVELEARLGNVLRENRELRLQAERAAPALRIVPPAAAATDEAATLDPRQDLAVGMLLDWLAGIEALKTAEGRVLLKLLRLFVQSREVSRVA